MFTPTLTSRVSNYTCQLSFSGVYIGRAQVVLFIYPHLVECNNFLLGSVGKARSEILSKHSLFV